MYCWNTNTIECFSREIGSEESSIVLNVSNTWKDIELKYVATGCFEYGCRWTLPVKRLVCLLIPGNYSRWCADMSSDDEDGGKFMGLEDSMNFGEDVVVKYRSHGMGRGVGDDRVTKLDRVEYKICFVGLDEDLQVSHELKVRTDLLLKV